MIGNLGCHGRVRPCLGLTFTQHGRTRPWHPIQKDPLPNVLILCVLWPGFTALLIISVLLQRAHIRRLLKQLDDLRAAAKIAERTYQTVLRIAMTDRD